MSSKTAAQRPASLWCLAPTMDKEFRADEALAMLKSSTGAPPDASASGSLRRSSRLASNDLDINLYDLNRSQGGFTFDLNASLGLGRSFDAFPSASYAHRPLLASLRPSSPSYRQPCTFSFIYLLTPLSQIVHFPF